MRPAHLLQLLLLATIWGAAYPITRSAVAHFGPFPLIALRMGIAAAVLLPLLAMTVGLGGLRRHWRLLTLQGVMFTAVSFTVIAWASLTIGAGVAAVLNATAPMFGALVAWAWLRERIGPWKALGLAVGTIGVAILMWGQVSLRTESSTLMTMAIAAMLFSSLMWGIAANYTRTRMAQVDSLTLTVGGMAIASLVLAPLAWAEWHGWLFAEAPGMRAITRAPGTRAWVEVLLLGVFSSGFGFVLYYHLLRAVGTVPTMATTFLNPAIAMLGGAWWLAEPITARMIGGGAVVLLGTGLAVGLWPRPDSPRPPSPPSTKGARR